MAKEKQNIRILQKRPEYARHDRACKLLKPIDLPTLLLKIFKRSADKTVTIYGGTYGKKTRW
jgi:hypothetical protein